MSRHWTEITFCSDLDGGELPIEVRIFTDPTLKPDLAIGAACDARVTISFDHFADSLDGIERFGQRVIDAAKAVRDLRANAALAECLPKLVPILNGEGTPLGDAVPPRNFKPQTPDEVRMEELRAERQTWLDARWEHDHDGGKLWALEFSEKARELRALVDATF